MTLEEKIENIIPLSDLMPAVVVVLQVRDFQPVYMSGKGLENLGITPEDFRNIDRKFFEQFLKKEEMEDIQAKLDLLMTNKDPRECFTLFQQVKSKEREERVWHITSVRIFYQDENKEVTHTISVSFPVDLMKHIPNKAERIFAENEFFRKNLQDYMALGHRAKEVLRLVALGRSSAEIARELSISVETVNTHRKKIKQKLGLSSTYDFTEYAHAFDLI